jgi:hypothetical protein
MLFVASSGTMSDPEVCAFTIWWVLRHFCFLCFPRHLLVALFGLGKGWWAV